MPKRISGARLSGILKSKICDENPVDKQTRVCYDKGEENCFRREPDNQYGLVLVSTGRLKTVKLSVDCDHVKTQT